MATDQLFIDHVRVREATRRLTYRRTPLRAYSHASIMEPEPNTAKAAAINEYGKLMLSHKVSGVTHTPGFLFLFFRAPLTTLLSPPHPFRNFRSWMLRCVGCATR